MATILGRGVLPCISSTTLAATSLASTLAATALATAVTTTTLAAAAVTATLPTAALTPSRSATALCASIKRFRGSPKSVRLHAWLVLDSTRQLVDRRALR